jgi:hypothetical protein
MCEGGVEASALLALLLESRLENWEVWAEGHTKGEGTGRDSDRDASVADFLGPELYVAGRIAGCPPSSTPEEM